MSENKTPAIRFQGFMDDWEDHKLGDVFQEYSEKNHEELPVLTIVQGKGTVLRDESNRNLQYDKSSLSNYKMVKKDDFIVHLRSFEGGFEKATSNGIISPAYHTLHGDDTDSSFYYPFFRSKNFIECLLKPHVYGIRDGKSIDIEGMKTIDIPVPSFSEQQKIGGYLDQVDYLITLHQRKLTKLQLLKKSMLTKMFPKDGTRVPEIRFQGFHGEWKQCKLGNLADSFEYGLNAAAKKFDGQNKYIRITDIDDSTHEFMQSELTSPDTVLKQANNYKLHEGDILFARTGASVGKTYIYKKSDGHVYYAGFLIRAKISEKYFSEFVFQNTLTSNYDKNVRITSQRSGQPGVNAQEYAEFKLLVPKIEEQHKVGKFLRSIDSLITLQQRKLSKLQQIKQAMLSKLFV